ncbi:MAG: hypothetical protein WD604_11555 [Balneolaceae bacterium]
MEINQMEAMMSIITRKISAVLMVLILSAGLISCSSQTEQVPRLSMFVGIDISGSFVNSGAYENSIAFLANYLYAHVNGIGEFEEPNVLFVSSIGGVDVAETKTFYPIHSFQNKSVTEIEEYLKELYPKDQLEPITDFNAFFEHVARTVENQNLLLRPISVILISDGVPDYRVNGENLERNFRDINVNMLERLSRNITIRLLYTNPSDGRSWQTEVPRRRVKIWTQDADVMETWDDSTIYIPDLPIEQQERWMEWTMSNVNYNVRARRVD